MRSRFLPPVLLLALLWSLLTPAPASATIRASISFRHYNFHLFSPFPGPARINLSWGSSDPDVELTFRLHRATTVLHTATYDLETPGFGSKVVGFTWPAESVNEPTDYRITVHRGSSQLRSRTFTLHSAARHDHLDQTRSVLPTGPGRLPRPDDGSLPPRGELGSDDRADLSSERPWWMLWRPGPKEEPPGPGHRRPHL